MANLFNLDIDHIMHDGNEVLLMMLNGNIVYEKETFRIEYAVAPVDRCLNESDPGGSFGICYFGLPRIYSRYGKDLYDDPNSDTDDVGEYNYNYSKVEIIKKDGTRTSDLSTKCNEISKVKLWYPETTEAIRFIFIDSFGSALEDITYCNMRNFVSAKYMFYSCDYNLKSIKNVSKWCTKNLTDMSFMFAFGYSGYTQDSYLTEIDLDNVDTSKATDMSAMFYNCDALTTLNLSSFNTNNVINMDSMFSECNLLQELDIRNFVIVDECDVDNMLEDCNNLHTLHLDNCNNDTIRKIINSGGFPIGTIDGVTRTIYCKGANASGLVAPASWVFNYIDGVIPEEPVIPDKPLYKEGQFRDNTTITEANVLVTSNYTSLANMFSGCTSLVSVNTEGWDTSNVIDMSQMFYNCKSLIDLDLSSFNLRNVSYTDYMFTGCTSLRRLYLNNCGKNTISKIIKKLPTNAIRGETRTIYCKEANAKGLTAPTNWVFSYID